MIGAFRLSLLPDWLAALVAAALWLKKSASTGHLLKTGNGHLATSCPTACPYDSSNSIDITVSGVDAGICTGCYNDFSATSARLLELGYDGSFNLPFDGPIDKDGDRVIDGCRFRAQFDRSDPTAKAENHNDNACSDLVNTERAYGVEITVETDLSGNMTRAKLLELEGTTPGGAAGDSTVWRNAFEWTGSTPFEAGTSVSNDQQCDVNEDNEPFMKASGGGTVTIDAIN